MKVFKFCSIFWRGLSTDSSVGVVDKVKLSSATLVEVSFEDCPPNESNLHWSSMSWWSLLIDSEVDCRVLGDGGLVLRVSRV